MEGKASEKRQGQITVGWIWIEEMESERGRRRVSVVVGVKA